MENEDADLSHVNKVHGSATSTVGLSSRRSMSTEERRAVATMHGRTGRHLVQTLDGGGPH